MVNKVVLEYLRVNRGNYNLADLKKKILASGHSQKDIDGALAQLNAQSGGNAPSVNATINKINKTNIPVQQATPAKLTVNAIGKKAKNLKKPKKSKKKLIIILSIVLLVLLVLGFAGWWFFLR
ncbi:MAG: hypothetical protein KAS01_02935 [Candidatus Pacebacteria bacterium]|nr:hypothetical protein [Candidatus Paceibacterota bacterium]